MGILRGKKSKSASSATSPCAQLRAAYHDCFNRLENYSVFYF